MNHIENMFCSIIIIIIIIIIRTQLYYNGLFAFWIHWNFKFPFLFLFMNNASTSII